MRFNYFLFFIVLSFFSLSADEKLLNDQIAYKSLYSSLSKSLENHTPNYRHIVKHVSEQGRYVFLEGGLSFSINWWYRSTSINWKPGDQIYITCESANNYRFEHAATHGVIWGSDEKLPQDLPEIQKLTKGTHPKIFLSNDYVFKVSNSSFLDKKEWKEKDRIVVFSNGGLYYQLWNIDKGSLLLCKFEISFEDVLGLEERLNQKVLQQQEAAKTVASSLVSYSAGLKERQRPIGVFLFLGPTGVGKTELAKSLTKDLYKDDLSLLRFDMSHFNESHSSSRLLGSPPGYENHDEGGQLTKPLLKNPYMIVLLDEMEKAHSQVHKMFLPVFDEGFILDNKNKFVDCSNVIFIMTSNLGGTTIARLYGLGYSEEDILAEIEPLLMEKLSPELYNRVEPVLFRPLEKKTMVSLVDLILTKLIERVWEEKEIHLMIDDNLKEYLIEKGFHPLLGARPLKKLIDKRVVSNLANKIISDKIESGSIVTMSYDEPHDAIILTLD